MSFWSRLVAFVIDLRVVVLLLALLVALAGLSVMPFSWAPEALPRDPVPVDAIPDIGENQQIVFTKWMGRSPADIEAQVTYPLTTALMGIPGVKSVRSFSMFGFSSIYVIFEEGIEFYWSRSRILEKLNALPANLLPDGVSPTLGPDATGLGQVFWYTLEGRDPDGNVVGGWDLHELRTLQDWSVRYALQSAPGVSEVSSIGGHVKEYQIDLDPEAMRGNDVTLAQVVRAVRESNLDVGARTMEINAVEYVVRGVGFLRNIEDLEESVVVARENTPIRLRDVARVSLGPTNRRGALDMAGAEAVGGIVVARYGANPREVIDEVKEKIAEIETTLPSKRLEDGTISKVTIVPFYDRSQLIDETLSTLSAALIQQILITIIVVLLLLRNLRSSLLVSLMLPLSVLGTFVAMRYTGVDANIMSLAGIAIAIGTIVDVGIVLTENVVESIDRAPPDAPRTPIIVEAAGEVAPAILTSVATTVVSFLPVFALTASEGKLFRPLAFTKTYALIAAVVLSLAVLPPLAALVFRRFRRSTPEFPSWATAGVNYVLAAILVVVLALYWMPLGPGAGGLWNIVFVATTVALVVGSFALFQRAYEPLLRAFLANKLTFLVLPLALVVVGFTAWRGFDRTFGWLPEPVRLSAPVVKMAHAFPGFGREFMPPFDEGSFLVMPSTMPHASFGQSLQMLQDMDARIQAIPEVELAVGKLGRAESALDPAPVSMFETIVTYKPEWRIDENGERVRQWRDHIESPADIWEEIVAASEMTGLTSAPKLMPIQTRLVMLQTGMRAPMGLKVYGPDLESIETAALTLEDALKQVPSIRPPTVFAERIVGKPYLEIHVDREAAGRHGLTVRDVQNVIQFAIGGDELTRTVEGRERYPVRVRYSREERDSLDALHRVLVPTPAGAQIPLEQVAQIRYVRGPQVIKSEDTFTTGYVTFDRVGTMSEVEVVEMAQEYLRHRLASGELRLPEGVSYEFTGSYENQVRSEKRLAVLIPIALVLVFLLLYLQFRTGVLAAMIYTSVAVAVSGGFLLVWLYGQPWFLDVGLAGTTLRDLFQIAPTNMSVAVWVGFIALVGIATDDSVVMSTYLQQVFAGSEPTTVAEVRERVVSAGLRRIRPCLMTTATTILALLPILTSTDRGSDVMIPMAIPAVGGMSIALITLFVLPVLYSAWKERSV